MVGLQQHTHTHSMFTNSGTAELKLNVGGKLILRGKVKLFFYLLGQLEILHQVLLPLSQLKYSLQGEFDKKEI